MSTVLVFTSKDDAPHGIIQNKLQKLYACLNAEPKIISLPDDSIHLTSDSINGIIYIASFCADLKLLLKGISCLIKNTNVQCLSLLVDLLVTERPFVYNSRENQFFREYYRLVTIRNIDLQVTTSNRLRNRYGEDDTYICSLPELMENNIYYWNKVKEEVQFHEMFNQGNAVPRLVSIQSIADINMGRPLYRHPNDEEPPNIEMIPIVKEILAIVEKHTNISGINHVLIQWYRNGRDNIAAHSDKTLDIDLNTPIINVSLGISRVMTIQHKQEKTNFVEKIPLNHGECVVFGLQTNKLWHHEVAKDVTVSNHDIYNQERISFTFRKIATFINNEGIIVGQGSPYKSLEDIETRKNDEEVLKMKDNQTRVDLIHAFSCENRQSNEFNWNAVYGKGFLIR